MPEVLIPSTALVVGLGLLASVGWGVADFGGGFTSRNAPVLGVLLLGQVTGGILSIGLVAVAHEPAMRPADLAIAAAGGAVGAVGLALLYRGLAIGRMGVVAPVASVLTALLPVGFGFVTQSVPAPLAILGIVLALLSVVLVSRAPGEAGARPSGLPYALGAGSLFGCFTIVVAQLGDGLVLSPIFVIRVVSALATVGMILVGRQAWRVPRRLWPAAMGVGAVDMLATVLYLSAIQVGPLAIAAIMASLYPVITAILAAVILRERVTLIHGLGIGAAGVAVVLITAAS